MTTTGIKHNFDSISETEVQTGFDTKFNAIEQFYAPVRTALIQHKFNAISGSEKAAGIIAQFDILIQTRSTFCQKHFALFPERWEVIALNVDTDIKSSLGFIGLTDDPLRLSDIALADGKYEIFLKYNSLFWDDARDARRTTIKIDSGIISWGNIPRILNLRRKFDTQFSPSLFWEISSEYNQSGLSVGIWFSALSPVDISGFPDNLLTVFENQGEYSLKYEQSSNIYAAVACINSEDERGEKAELSLPWTSSPPDSPNIQYAKEDVE